VDRIPGAWVLGHLGFSNKARIEVSRLMTATIRSAAPGDAADLADIYNHYVANSCITFETEPLSSQQMAHRVAETIATPLPWLVAEESTGLIGFAYASMWRGRRAYRFSVETTIYLDAARTRQGIGSKLYIALIDALRETSMHSAIGGIALPNEASIQMHERMGFRKVGHFEQIGYKLGRWVDVGYWQLAL